MADTLDVLTFAEAKAAINRSDTTNTELDMMVTAVSRRLDDACGAIVTRTLTDELHDGGGRLVRLTWRPITALTSCSEYNSAGTATTLTEEDYDTKPANAFTYDARSGLLYRRSSGRADRFEEGFKNVRVTYNAGRAATTAAVDAKFKQAAAIILGHMWRGEQGGGSVVFGPGGEPVELPGVPGFFVPRAAVELLADELLGGPPLLLGGRR